MGNHISSYTHQEPWEKSMQVVKALAIALLLSSPWSCPWMREARRRRNKALITTKKRSTPHTKPLHGVLLINLGTPDNTSYFAVRRYLSEFLMDGRVIDVTYWLRFILVRCIIAPFRSPVSAKSYRTLFGHYGGVSPLKKYGNALVEKVQEKLGADTHHVVLGMRYQNPSILSAVTDLVNAGVTDITVLPLFPQYASSSTGSAIQEAMRCISQLDGIPSTRFISQFVSEPLYINAVYETAKDLVNRPEGWDCVVMSFHGVPYRHVMKTCAYCQEKSDICMEKLDATNALCYRALCYATARNISEKLNLDKSQYMVMFQSRLGYAEWLQPYAALLVPTLASKGYKRVLALSLSFVADCLETTMEVGEDFKVEFLNHGGEEWVLVPSLNVHEAWVECVCKLVTKSN